MHVNIQASSIHKKEDIQLRIIIVIIIIIITVIFIILVGPFYRSGTLYSVLRVISRLIATSTCEVGTDIIALWQRKK